MEVNDEGGVVTFDMLFAVGFFGETDVDHDVGGVGDVQVEVGGSFGAEQGRSVGVVHLGPQVRADEAVGQTPGQIQPPFPPRVIRQRERFHQVGVARREQLRKVVSWRPILSVNQSIHTSINSYINQYINQ